MSDTHQKEEIYEGRYPDWIWKTQIIAYGILICYSLPILILTILNYDGSDHCNVFMNVSTFLLTFCLIYLFIPLLGTFILIFVKCGLYKPCPNKRCIYMIFQTVSVIHGLLIIFTIIWQIIGWILYSNMNDSCLDSEIGKVFFGTVVSMLILLVSSCIFCCCCMIWSMGQGAGN